MAKQKKKRFNKVEEKVPRNCPFCKANTNPDYKDYEALAKYLSDRAKLLGKDRTGICSKHQKRVAISIKRARHLALLPYVPSV